MHGFTACRDSLNAKTNCKQGGTECNDVQYARMYYTQGRGSTVCTDVLYAREGEYTQYSMQGCTECRDLLCVGNWMNSKPLAFLQLLEMFLSSKKKNLFVTVF